MRVAVSLPVRGVAHHPAMSSALPQPTRSNHPVLRGLLREWQGMSHRPEMVQQARGWAVPVEFESLDDLVAATGWYNTAHERNTATGATGGDAVTERLLLAARTDDLAARVVLQRLLPGLVSLACRWQRRHDGDAFADVLAAAWPVIRQYPFERRPLHLVANLLNDCEYHAYRRAHRRMLVHVPVEAVGLERPDECGHAEPLHELVDVVSCTASLTAHDRRLLGLLLSGRSILEVAATLEVSERTVRNPRDSMVSRIREALAA